MEDSDGQRAQMRAALMAKYTGRNPVYLAPGDDED